MSDTFVLRDFVPPEPPKRDEFILEPLGPDHNERDHAAWTSSIDHIRNSPGFPMPDGWPTPMGLDENLADLQMHSADFTARRGFTYTVLSPTDRDVIGCVYIYPGKEEGTDALVRSWVRASHAHRDGLLWGTVADWLAAEWPFERIDDAGRANLADRRRTAG